METILKVLRELFAEDDQRNTSGEVAGSIPETSRLFVNESRKNDVDSGGQRGIFARRFGVDCEPVLVKRLVA